MPCEPISMRLSGHIPRKIHHDLVDGVGWFIVARAATVGKALSSGLLLDGLELRLYPQPILFELHDPRRDFALPPD